MGVERRAQVGLLSVVIQPRADEVQSFVFSSAYVLGSRSKRGSVATPTSLRYPVSIVSVVEKTPRLNG